MNPLYAIADISDIYSPGLLFYKDLIRRNIARSVELAGSASRLRPHVKTHKTREIVRLALDAGIAKHKCATLAEAEMLASCGVKDVLIAYNMVGPNCGRMARLARAYPDCRFAVTADDAAAADALSRAMAAEGQTVDVLIDLDVGQHRTGVAPGPEAAGLYEHVAGLPGLRPGGLHVYDGHNHQSSFVERQAAALHNLEPALALRDDLVKKGLPVPRLVVGGTPTFPVYAKLDLPGLELSPGTCFLHDHGYSARFADLSGFTPAALLLTRVISRPSATRLTLDLGTKAVASDPPAGGRCVLLDVPDHVPILQNEEHFVVETPAAHRFRPGDAIFVVPTHVCPTCALHQFAYVIEDGRLADKWSIAARDRILTI
jgi:D-serine deaminase-like pyridoxal phosphate-dependent protein